MHTIEQDFLIPSASWHSISSKLINREMEDILCQSLTIKDYSDAVKQYYFMLIAVPADNPNHDNWAKYYSKKRGVLYNNLKLNFDGFESVNLEEAYQMQAELYLKSVFEIPTLRGMKNTPFDAQKLYEDVRELFIQQGWLKNIYQTIET